MLSAGSRALCARDSCALCWVIRTRQLTTLWYGQAVSLQPARPAFVTHWGIDCLVTWLDTINLVIVCPLF
jgi:hypothetical protein